MIGEIILGIAALVFILISLATLVMIAFEDTETFRVIDEKIARAIRGKDRE